MELQRLRPDHEAAVLAFERANRAYFAESISDRGDEFFADFGAQYRAVLAEQEAGTGYFHVLFDKHGAVMGRFNLYSVVDATAEVGYRVAQRASGRGVATTGLREMCRIAQDEYGLRTLWATASNENVASQRVLAKVGFIAIGSTDVAGREGTRFELVLAVRQ